ncbi:MAG: toll/interleukin-1 receptor domain-containing protein [Saprospiraceae bacterium]|nr:toll/interleukin-1 receptor domain-containing protein [Saprospiraceae bacterium]
MANASHLEYLLRGVSYWNSWRLQEPELKPDLSDIRLGNQSLENANLQGVNLSGSVFVGTNLNFANLRDADLRRVSWEKVSALGADFSGADFGDSHLKLCNFSMAILLQTQLSGTTLVDCDFTETILHGVNLDKVNFKEKMVQDIRLGSEEVLEETRGGLDMRGYAGNTGGIQLADEGPRSASEQPVLAAKPGDTVACSVYAPEEAAPQEPVQVQVWLHLLEEAAVVGQLAVSIDDTAVLRQFSNLGVPVQPGERLRLVLSLRGETGTEQTRETTWKGSRESQQFVVDIPDTPGKQKVFFVLRVFLQRSDWMPVGEISFFIKVAGATSAGKPVGSEAKRYHYAFVSYASKDRQEVLRRVQMLGIFDQKFFMDVLSLRPGEEWEPALEQHILDCDLFLLFWSTNARNSEWVLKEVKLALARKNGRREAPPFIQPIPLELPVVPPPPELGHLHVNDHILYLIAPES